MFKWFKMALGVGLQVATLFKGGKKPTLTEALPFAMAKLLPAIENAVKFGGMDTREKLDAYLALADAGTGNDATAVDFIRNLPADKEEQLFDHLIEAARIYGYSLIGVEGYTE